MRAAAGGESRHHRRKMSYILRHNGDGHVEQYELEHNPGDHVVMRVVGSKRNSVCPSDSAPKALTPPAMQIQVPCCAGRQDMVSKLFIMAMANQVGVQNLGGGLARGKQHEAPEGASRERLTEVAPENGGVPEASI